MRYLMFVIASLFSIAMNAAIAEPIVVLISTPIGSAMAAFMAMLKKHGITNIKKCINSPPEMSQACRSNLLACVGC